MAKNWTMAEAVREIKKGNKEAIMEVGKKFPLLHNLIARALSGDVEATFDLLTSFPEHITCNKINVALKGAIEEVEEVVEEQPSKPAKGKKIEKVEDDGDEENLEAMTTKQLYQLCIDRGIKVPKYGKSKAFYIEALQGQDEEDVEEETQAEEKDENPYEGMSAVEAFKECKKRGLKVQPKKPAKVYIDMLLKDDAAKAEVEEDDDWGEDEEAVEEKPTKAKGKAKSKPAPKEEDDDDDWDI